MAQILSVSVYGRNNQNYGTSQGRTIGLPVSRLMIESAPANSVYNGVTTVTQITVLPTGDVYPGSPSVSVFFTPTALATVITAANA